MIEHLIELIQKLESPEQCMIIAREARKRALELRSMRHGFNSPVENELLKVLYAYEDVLSAKNKKKTRASRTWNMVKKYGIIETAERAVNRNTDAMGFTLLVAMGLDDLTFEAVILKYPEYFSPEGVAKAKHRLDEMKRHHK